MLIDCYQNNIDIALFHPHSRAKGIGTLGKIILIEKNHAGDLSIMIQGLLRIKLHSLVSENPYPQYLIGPYEDFDEKTLVLPDYHLTRLHQVLHAWLDRHVHSASERATFMKDMNSPDKLINNLCMFVIKDTELKVIFLESTSLLDRVRMMNALLIGETPETENIEIGEAIKNFERLEPDQYKNAS